jgi:hypothetical protein
MAVHARTLEIYSKLGIAQRALELGRRGNGANMWAQGKRRARIPIGDIGKSLSPFPFVLVYPQDVHERILIAHLARENVHVERATELTGFTQDAEGVRATLHTAQGTETVRAAYVCGCDGAGSATRHALGIEFPGRAVSRCSSSLTLATGPWCLRANVCLARGIHRLFFRARGRSCIGMAASVCAESAICFRDGPSVAEAGADLSFKLRFDLSDPPSLCLTFPEALLPSLVTRRTMHNRWAGGGHEHRAADAATWRGSSALVVEGVGGPRHLGRGASVILTGRALFTHVGKTTTHLVRKGSWLLP